MAFSNFTGTHSTTQATVSSKNTLKYTFLAFWGSIKIIGYSGYTTNFPPVSQSCIRQSLPLARSFYSLHRLSFATLFVYYLLNSASHFSSTTHENSSITKMWYEKKFRLCGSSVEMNLHEYFYVYARLIYHH